MFLVYNGVIWEYTEERWNTCDFNICYCSRKSFTLHGWITHAQKQTQFFIQTYLCNGQLVNTRSLFEEINKKSQARIKMKFKNSKD